jgi:undecaprenyl-diphosphatase
VKEAKHIADGVGWASTAIGTVVSGVVAYASIAWLLRYASKNNFTGFIIYRLALALVIVVLLTTQVISAV